MVGKHAVDPFEDDDFATKILLKRTLHAYLF
jgi:hypothetical protein